MSRAQMPTRLASLDDDLALAHRLADTAAATSMPFFGRNIERWTKTDGSLATEADVRNNATFSNGRVHDEVVRLVASGS